MKKLLTFLLLFFVLCGVFAQVNTVEVLEDAQGFRLMVDGEPMDVKGMVWSYNPIGENPNYDLWSQPDEFIRTMIDRDAEMMKAMGVNAIRVFSIVPAEWIQYFYYQHNIYTIVNYTFGRYGMSVRGQWHPYTDYSDWYTREAIKQEALAVVEEFKDVPGVLMFLFGNENNYGLEWSSNQIENLPVGQRLEMRAGYLYSLFEEAISEAKEIDSNHPMGIVNGDIQYLNIIKALIPSMDILGVNTYRGAKAYDLFYQSISDLGVPFVFTELGADAYNVRTQTEDQYSQALYLKDQWEEIYQQSWGKGGYQNCLGGFVFEWVDEWWKLGFDENLDVHDTQGSWTNGGYNMDAQPGLNNMNEEWFGIVAQSVAKDNGINRRIPRAAYYTLADIWALPLYDSTLEEVDAHFSQVNPLLYLSLGESNVQKGEENEPMVRIDGFSIDLVMSESFSSNEMDTAEDNDRSPMSALAMNRSEELSLDLAVQPAENLHGDISIRVRGEQYDPFFVTEAENQDLIELYSASFEYDNPYFDLYGYYHTGLADWQDEGDFFNLKPESWDLYNMDIEGAKAPYGIMFAGNENLEGLKIYAGPEIYWGAEPQALAKYMKDFYLSDFNMGFAAMAGQEFNVGDDAAADTDPSTLGSLYGYFEMAPYVRIDLGGLYAGSGKVGQEYTYAEEMSSGLLYGETNEIEMVDCFAGKVEVETDVIPYASLYASYTYAGLVADYNASVPRGGFFKADDGVGNREEISGGAEVIYSDLTLNGVVRYRRPLENALPLEVGVFRDPLNDPFVVYQNRETMDVELVVSYDPTGATWFHEWNYFDIENAPIAASATLLYNVYSGITDPTTYKNESGDLASFSTGLPEEENLWACKFKMVANPFPLFRVGLDFHMGSQQSMGEDDRIVDYMGGGLKLRYRRIVLDSMVEVDGWGPESWYREFNITYPLQWKADLSYSFDSPSLYNSVSKVGLFGQGRTFDDYYTGDDPVDADYLVEMGLYSSISY